MLGNTITKQEAQDARKYMTFAKTVQTGQTIEDKGDLYEIVEIPPTPLTELQAQAKQNLETLTARLRAEQSTFNGITIAKTYENINEWLTFAKYKADENISIPAQAVMMSYSGQNMNAFSVPQIEGAMYQAMVEITSINANYYSTLASIENATTAEEIPNIQG